MKNTTQKFLSALCATIMTVNLTLVATAFAEEEATLLIATRDNYTEGDSEILKMPEKTVSGGVVTQTSDSRITLEIAANNEVELIVGEDTLVLDENLASIKLSDVKKGMHAVAVCSSVSTLSLPPQTAAFYIVVGDNAENLPLAAIIESVEKSENGTTIVNSTENQYRLTVNSDTRIVPLRTRNIVGADNLSRGDVIFFYVDILTMSIPAQGTPSKIVLVEDNFENEKSSEENGEEEVSEIVDFHEVGESDKVSMNVLFNQKLSDNEVSVMRDGEEIILNVDENTLITDTDFLPIDLSAAKKDSLVYVVASSQMTLSLPAQTYAYAIIVSENENLPLYVKIASVTDNKDGGKELLSADGIYRINVPASCRVRPMYTRNILTQDDLSVNDEIFVFPTNGVATLSLPSLVSAEKIVMWNDDVDMDVYVSENGIKYYPLRKMCEENGLSVKWNADTQSVQVGTTAMGVFVTIGKNEYSFARATARALSGAPILVSDKNNPGYGITYVPEDFFTEILEINPNGNASKGNVEV